MIAAATAPETRMSVSNATLVNGRLDLPRWLIKGNELELGTTVVRTGVALTVMRAAAEVVEVKFHVDHENKIEVLVEKAKDGGAIAWERLIDHFPKEQPSHLVEHYSQVV